MSGLGLLLKATEEMSVAPVEQQRYDTGRTLSLSSGVEWPF